MEISNTHVWLWRLSMVLALLGLCLIAGSGLPALAFALAWGLNGVFLGVVQTRFISADRKLGLVTDMEAKTYRWLGADMAKALVASPVWSRVVGVEPWPRRTARGVWLSQLANRSASAEVVHALTLVTNLLLALVFMVTLGVAAAVWLTLFNLFLNGLPVMLQRRLRWRLQRLQQGGPTALE